MTLGGLKEGVTPLEMAYAYTTIANHGVRVSGSLASSPMGPVAIDSVKQRRARRRERAQDASGCSPRRSGEVAEGMLAGVVQGGTGKAAQIGEFAAGKTGTTENYGDAWFVGYNRQMTVAVWVGLPRRAQADEDRVPRRPGGRRHLPHRDLARLHDVVHHRPRPPRRRAGQEARDRGGARGARPRRVPAVPQQEQSGRARADPAAGRRRPSRTTPDQAPQRTPAPRQPSTPAQPQQPAPQAPAQTPTPAPGAGGGAAPTP